MMQISSNVGIGSLNTVQSFRQNNQVDSLNGQSAKGLTPVDQVDFSSEAQAILSGDVNETESENRSERIAGIRREIASGSYDSDEKVLAALDKFLDIYG
jgi:anti-sigma28 factor (negative regulator of flagellin synthesis)